MTVFIGIPAEGTLVEGLKPVVSALPNNLFLQILISDFGVLFCNNFFRLASRLANAGRQ